MKKHSIKILLIIIVVSISSCSVHSTSHSHSPSAKAKKMPPGQAKKINGDKSARNYAPGHRKN